MVRVSSTGSIVWGPLAVFDQASVPIAHLPQMQSDGDGGAVIWWHRSISNVFNSCVQHVSSAGAELWGHNGVTVSTLVGRYHINPTCTFDPESGATYCFWNEETTNQNQWGIRGQRFLADGTRNWGTDGIAFVPMRPTFRSSPRSARPGFALATAVPTVVYAEQPTGAFGDERVHAFCPEIDGATNWGPVDVATTLSTKSRLPLAVDVSGTVRVIWEDDRNGTPDVYGQAIRIDGTLGAATTDAPENSDGLVPISPASLSAWPNPFRMSTRIAVPSSATAIDITDATGRLVRRLVVRPGDLSVSWDGRDASAAALPAGVYFAKIVGGSGTTRPITVRLTRVREGAATANRDILAVEFDVGRMVDQVERCSRRDLEEASHLATGGLALSSLARATTSLRSCFQNSGVTSTGAPLSRPSRRRCSSRSSSRRFRSSRMSSRRYSLALPYPPLATTASIHSRSDSGNEILSEVMSRSPPSP